VRAAGLHLQQEQPTHPRERRDIGAGRRVGREEPDNRSRRVFGQGLSQPQHRQRTAQPAGIDGDLVGPASVVGVGRGHRDSSWARTAATACGRALTRAATSSARVGVTDSNGRVTRMLP
jgi:hypothetical protein